MDDLERARQCAAYMYENDAASRSLGIDIEIPAAGEAVARMPVRDDMVNGFDICHGGIVFTLADTAFAFACNAYDDLTVSSSGNIEFRRPTHRGDTLTAAAHEVSRDEKCGEYAVVVTNQLDELVAKFGGRSVSRGKPLLDQD